MQTKVMDNKYLQTIIMATVLVCVTAPPKPQPCTQPAFHVWPLGPVMNDLDIVGNTRGTVGNVTIGSIQPAVGYESTRFLGSSGSFISMAVDAYIPPGANDDYSFQFYVKFDTVTQGTILSFESHSYDGIPSTTEVRKYQLAISNGDIFIHVTDFAQTTIATALLPNTWYHIALSRDLNQNELAIYLNHNTQKIIGPISQLADNPTLFPANVVLGQDIDGSNPLHGEMACFQFVPCRDAIDTTYDNNCIPAAWPITSSTNLPSTTTSTTTTSSATTTATTTTLPVTTTTTITPTTVAEDNTAGSSCMQYKVVNHDVTFGSPADILDVVYASTTLDCARRCNLNPSCQAFTFDGTICSLGVNGTTVFSAGTKLFTREL